MSFSHFFFFLYSSDAQRKYEDNCDSLHEESVSETAENSGEEAGDGALDAEAGEMTDGGEDDYDEEGSHHLVQEMDEWKGDWGRDEALMKVNFQELFIAPDLRMYCST